MRILNLYAGIGGNRKLWGDKHEVIAVELDPKIAKIYRDFFPTDKVIVGDAHKYLLEHFREFDFIWSSPPCPTHSKLRNSWQDMVVYPNMQLYEEIILLKYWFKGKWVVENVVSYYDPLIKPYHYKGHYYWANFVITGDSSYNRGMSIRSNATPRESLETHTKKTGFDLSSYTGIDKMKTLRNCVEPEAGLSIFQFAFKKKQEVLF